MTDIVSGWSDDHHVYLVIRDGERISCRKFPAKWSAFVTGMDEDDRRTLGRSNEILGVAFDGRYTRIDFRTRWARKEGLARIANAIKARNMDRALYASDEEFENSAAAGIWEGDVGPLRRFLSDNPGITISATPRLAYFDLETDSRKSFEQALEGKARILSWALEDEHGNRFDAVLEADNDDAERALIGAFFEVAARFDCLLAWNGDGFDFPVLEKRIGKLKVRKLPPWTRWCWLDHLAVFKKYNQAHESGEERTSFALGAVAQHLLGEGKHDFDASKTWEAWAAGGEERERMPRYNVQDTALLPRIEAKTGFVALHLAVCQVTRCFPDSSSLGAGNQGDGFMLALGAARGYRFATKRDFDDEVPGGFAGAFVMHPKKLGVIDNVHVCDFAGLYPSIMRSWNMSPDTLLDAREARRTTTPHCKLPDRDVYFRTDVRGLFAVALDELVAKRGEYTKRADDAEPGSEEWHRFKRLSSAFKIVANSFYGIVGSPFTRFYSREIAEGVTQTGAWLIKSVVRRAELAGLDPFYGDTDSVFASGDGEEFARIVREANESWPELLRGFGCTESRVKLDFEKSFRRLVIVSAKRYAARFARYKGKPAPDDMKPEVKGLEFKRGDTVRLAREMQKEAIDLLLYHEPLPGSDELRALVDRWRERILRGELGLEDVVLSQSIKDLGSYVEKFTTAKCGAKIGKGKAAKACGFNFGNQQIVDGALEACPKCQTPRKRSSLPAHVRVAKLLEARGEEVTAGTRIEYLVVRPPEGEEQGGEDDGKLRAVPAHDPGALEMIDRDYYWDRRIFGPTQRLLEAVFPAETWDDTAAKRRKAAAVAAKEAAKVVNRGKVEDLPLFGAVSHVAPLPKALNVSSSLGTPGPTIKGGADPLEVSQSGRFIGEEVRTDVVSGPRPRRRRIGT